jgi:AraC-like DNA-binding protein
VGITADKNVYILSAGQMIVHRPNEFHAIWSDCDSEPETVIFSFQASAFPEFSKRVYRLTPEKVTEIRDIYRAAERAFELKNNNVNSIKKDMEGEACAVVKRLELFLLSALSAENAVHSEYSGRGVENYIRILSVMENCLDKALTASELADLSHMSLPNLEKTVYRFSGCGAMAYYNGLKMQRAAELLSNGSSVKEVALGLGFSNQNYFSAAFKKWSGKAPSLYKKSP